VFAIRLRPRRIFTLGEYEQSGILSTKDDPINRLRRRHDFASSIRVLAQFAGSGPRSQKATLICDGIVVGCPASSKYLHPAFGNA
jgi:hypothetical protein